MPTYTFLCIFVIQIRDGICVIAPIFVTELAA